MTETTETVKEEGTHLVQEVEKKTDPVTGQELHQFGLEIPKKKRAKKAEEVVDKRKVFTPKKLRLSKEEKKEISAKIDKYLKLKVQVKICNEIEKELDELFIGVSKAKIGDYTIEGKTKERNQGAQKAYICNWWDWDVRKNK